MWHSPAVASFAWPARPQGCVSRTWRGDLLRATETIFIQVEAPFPLSFATSNLTESRLSTTPPAVELVVVAAAGSYRHPKLETSKNCNFSIGSPDLGYSPGDACHSVPSNGTVFENNVADLHGDAVSLRSPGSNAASARVPSSEETRREKGKAGLCMFGGTANDSMWISAMGDRFEGNVASEGSGGAYAGHEDPS